MSTKEVCARNTHELISMVQRLVNLVLGKHMPVVLGKGAYTTGKKIVIPPVGSLTETFFLSMHELAHNLNNANVKGAAVHKYQKLMYSFYNCFLDVCDERAFERNYKGMIPYSAQFYTEYLRDKNKCKYYTNATRSSGMVEYLHALTRYMIMKQRCDELGVHNLPDNKELQADYMAYVADMQPEIDAMHDWHDASKVAAVFMSRVEKLITDEATRRAQERKREQERQQQQQQEESDEKKDSEGGEPSDEDNNPEQEAEELPEKDEDTSSESESSDGDDKDSDKSGAGDDPEGDSDTDANEDDTSSDAGEDTSEGDVDEGSNEPSESSDDTDGTPVSDTEEDGESGGSDGDDPSESEGGDNDESDTGSSSPDGSSDTDDDASDEASDDSTGSDSSDGKNTCSSDDEAGEREEDAESSEDNRTGEGDDTGDEGPESDPGEKESDSEDDFSADEAGEPDDDSSDKSDSADDGGDGESDENIETSDDLPELSDEELEEVQKEVDKNMTSLDESEDSMSEVEEIRRGLEDAFADSGEYVKAPDVVDIITEMSDCHENMAVRYRDEGLQLLGPEAPKMVNLFVNNTKPHTIRYQRRGRLDLRRLNDPRESLNIFTKKYPGALEQSAVMLMVDHSQSMYEAEKAEVAAKLTSGLLYTLDKGAVPCAAFGYTDAENCSLAETERQHPIIIQQIKRFDEQYISAMKRCHTAYKAWCTPDLDAMREYAVPQLLLRKEKSKVLFVICDGLPLVGTRRLTYRLQYSYKKYIQVVRQMGIKVFAFGIKTDVSAFFDKDWAYVSTETLGQTLVDKLSEYLLRKD